MGSSPCSRMVTAIQRAVSEGNITDMVDVRLAPSSNHITAQRPPSMTSFQ